MQKESGLKVALLSLALLGSGSLLACHKDKPEKLPPVAVDPAELKRSAEASQQSLEELEPLLGALRRKVAALHEQFDPLPPGLPEFGDTRGRFYAAADGVGRLGSKLPWLAERIEAARKSGNSAELVAVSTSIAHTYDEVARANRLLDELEQQVQPFKKALEEKVELQALGKSTCE
jgi:hypothetical protein